MNYFTEHREGLAGTIIVHVIVLILMFMLGLFTPLPLPGEEGILVNFGNSDQGSGTEEPLSAPEQNTSVPVAEEEETVQTPPPEDTAPTRSKATEEILTQNTEKTVAVESANDIAERKKQEELDKQRKLEEEQKLEQQRERERLAVAARLKQEEEKRRIDQINSRAASAFGSSGAAADNSNDSGQGATFPAGNQGNPDGSAAADNYGTGSTGKASLGSGPSFSLSGRNALSLPKPAYPGNEEGVVVVAVTVDKYGKVTHAETGVQGSSTYNTSLMEAAKEAALRARFNADPNASALQKGTITYRFVLD